MELILQKPLVNCPVQNHQAKSNKLRVAIDTMGGDHAPEEIVKGAIRAASEGKTEIVLVGPEAILIKELSKYDVKHLPITIIKAEEVIKEGEAPAFAIYHKPNATIEKVKPVVIETFKEIFEYET